MKTVNVWEDAIPEKNFRCLTQEIAGVNLLKRGEIRE